MTHTYKPYDNYILYQVKSTSSASAGNKMWAARFDRSMYAPDSHLIFYTGRSFEGIESNQREQERSKQLVIISFSTFRVHVGLKVCQ